VGTIAPKLENVVNTVVFGTVFATVYTPIKLKLGTKEYTMGPL